MAPQSKHSQTDARDFERSLPPLQRKRLGQFFTGLPLGMLLASLVADRPTTVIDPMAGHGDLLEATRNFLKGTRRAALKLDGIEIDERTAEFARGRIAIGAQAKSFSSSIVTGSAFDPKIVSGFEGGGYDLVITNPPYVRYQAQAAGSSSPGAIRDGLRAILDARGLDAQHTWRRLVDGYSGLADLSIPSCLLAGLLCKPGGRLALVMPATWRTRDYADVLRYLLLRLFDIEFVVADRQPGWFSDALVRTHLIVAKRRLAAEAATPVGNRTQWPTTRWIEILPDAATETSLVGRAFPGPHPERALAAWLRGPSNSVPGIEVREYDSQREWLAVSQKLSRKTWFQLAEGRGAPLPLFSQTLGSPGAVIPDSVREVLPNHQTARLFRTEDSGIQVGQGLRTGCNRFFYVERLEPAGGRTIRVRTSQALGGTEMVVPSECLKPSVHKQSDLSDVEAGLVPRAMVLDLAGWVLPEDMKRVRQPQDCGGNRDFPMLRVMPSQLADYVRLASETALDDGKPDERIPDLSAVRTNVRGARGPEAPRFWYMLPRMAPRHRPAIFIPRVNHGLPRVIANPGRSLTIDANFSTIWPTDSGWSDDALYSLFSSAWVRACMEALGVPMGGGAVKLEATHLRQIPLPHLSALDRQELRRIGEALIGGASEGQVELDVLILRSIFPGSSVEQAIDLAERLLGQQLRSRDARRRTA